MQWFQECGRCRMRIEPRSGFLIRPMSFLLPCLPSMVIDTVPSSSGMRTMRLRRPKLAWAYGIFGVPGAGAGRHLVLERLAGARVGDVVPLQQGLQQPGWEPLQW